MARILSPLLLPLLIFACSGPKGATQPYVPSSQETYEYGTCPKDRDDCPRERTLACALGAVASKYNPCSKHEDCVAAAFEAKCSGAGACPPFYVNRQLQGGFEAEAQQEIDKYCATATCKGGAPCGIIQMEPYCANAHCTWIRTFSGGP